MSSKHTETLLKSLVDLINLKLIERFHEKYNKTICKLCDILIDLLNEKTGLLEKILLFNCQALYTALIFLENPESNCFDREEVQLTDRQLKVLKEKIAENLNLYDFQIEQRSKKFRSIRLNAVIKYDCELIRLLSAKYYSDQFMRFYDAMIQLNCQALYEIVDARLINKHHFSYDVLMQTHGAALLPILKLKLNKFRGELSPENLNIVSIHKSLKNVLEEYLNEGNKSSD